MEKITKYVAEDGKEFGSEIECLKYERGLKEFYGFQGYNRDGKEINPKDYADLDVYVDDLRYVKVFKYSGWEEFEDYCIEQDVYFYDGLEDINEIGLYFRDEDHDYWVSWEAEYEKLRVIRRKMNY